MNANQYTVLTRPRPIRAAFLIDTDKYPAGTDRLNALLDAIVDWNNTRWGGRTNHVAFFSGGALSDSEWRQIEIIDPDCILAFSPLSDNLLLELDERVNPWSIEIDDHTQSEVDRISIRMDGIGMPPTVENLRRIRARYPLNFGREEKLLVFEFAEGCDPEVRRFVHRNFGTYYQWFDPNSKRIRRIAWLEQLLPQISTHTVTVGDVDSLAAALEEISGRIRPRNSRPALPFIAPCQLASLFLESWPMGELNKTYQLIVGDSLADFGEHWNGVRRKSNWAETHRHQLWIPAKLAAVASFRESLHDWLLRHTNYGGGDRIELLTHSLSSESLADLRAYFRQHERAVHFDDVTPDQMAKRQEQAEQEHGQMNRFWPWTSDGDATRFTCSSHNERLSLPKPDPLQGEDQNGNWMVDVQIEHLSALRNTTREQSWWHLPRLNSRGVVFGMFRSPSRITRQGYFSVKAENQDIRASLVRRIKPELSFALPSDAALIRWMIAEPFGRPFFTTDARSKLVRARTVVSGCRISTKGAYLAGLIDLFGDFWTAKSFCERRFWRDRFSQLAGHGEGNDERLQKNLVDLLKANLAGAEEGRLQQATALADKILHLVRGRLKGHYLGFKDFLRERSRLEKQGLPETLVYPQGHTMVHHHGERPITVDEMREGLDALLEIGVLRLGVESECPRCKLASWHHLDDLRQHVFCTGCGNKYALRATELWSYALNSLAQMGVSQGVLSVLHALTAVASHALSFFVFSPSLDLFRNGENKPWHEVDVLCIANGEFVVGEVKEGFVQKTAFDELAEVAEALRPQRAIIFLPVENATKQWAELNGWLKQLQMRLSPQGIRAEIFTLPAF